MINSTVYRVFAFAVIPEIVATPNTGAWYATDLAKDTFEGSTMSEVNKPPLLLFFNSENFFPAPTAEPS